MEELVRLYNPDRWAYGSSWVLSSPRMNSLRHGWPPMTPADSTANRRTDDDDMVAEYSCFSFGCRTHKKSPFATAPPTEFEGKRTPLKRRREGINLTECSYETTRPAIWMTFARSAIYLPSPLCDFVDYFSFNSHNFMWCCYHHIVFTRGKSLLFKNSTRKG